MRIRVGTNFKSDDVPELEVVAGSNVAVTGTQTSAELVQITVSASGSGSGGGLVLTPTAVKNSNYSAASADYVPVSTQFGAVTVTLPTVPADATVIGVKMVVQASTNAVTVAAGGSDVFNKAVGPSTLTIAQLNQGVIVQYNAALAVWYVIVDGATIPALDTLGPTTDIATNNVTSAKHGLAPKSPGDASQFLNGAATPAYAQPKDSDLSTSDITTNNASTSKHGFTPKGDNNAAHFLNGQLGWSTPAGSGGMAADPLWNAKGDVAVGTGPAAATVLPAGANGQVLTVDSTQTDGVKWATPISGAGNPWSTTLATSASIGDSIIHLTDALPVFLANTSPPGSVFMVIDAWSVNAEAAECGPAANGKDITLFRGGTTHLQNAHAAGAPVIYMQMPEVQVDWWGAVPDSNPTFASINVAAINACMTQLQYFGGRGYGFTVRASAGQYAINNQVVLPAHGLGKLEGLNVICTSDFGSGKHAIDNTNGATCTLDGCNVQSSNPSMSMASFLSGGSAPPVAMDGFHCTDRMTVLNCTATGFHGGFHLDFFDHATMRDCSAKNNMYSWWFLHSGLDGGDMEFDKCNGDGAYRAHFGSAGGGPEGAMFTNCSWVNAPFCFFNCSPNAIFANCNREFLGNGSFYWDSSGGTLWVKWVQAGLNAGGYPTGGTWTDPNFPATATMQSAGNITLQSCEIVTSNPSGSYYEVDCPSGAATLNNCTFTDTAQGAAPLVKNGGVSGTTSRLILTNGAAQGFACIGIEGTVNAADLLEHNPITGKLRRTQTSGAPPAGVAWANASGGAVTSLDTGVVKINCGSNSIAAAKYVKADLSDPGYVATVLALNPQNFWELGETSFGSQAADAASGGHGTYTNTAGLAFSQTGIVGGGGAKAVKFTAASSGYVNINSGITNVGDTFTIECWLKLTSVGTAQTIIGAQAGAFRLGINASGNLEASRPSNPVIVDSTSTLSADGNFHHLVWTKATATNKLYIDGVDVTGSVTNATCGSSTAWNIGADPIGTGNLLNGTLQFLAVYTTALTSGNVSANYTAGSTSTTGSSAGHVIQASSFSDGPIVGRTLGASSSNQVKVKLTI